jgi:urate oxidase
VDLKMPNVHFLGLDLTKLARPYQRQVFLPTDEPHGEIEAIVAR